MASLPARSLRQLSQATAAVATTQSAAQPQALSARLPYFVPRNSNGNLPVYSDIRNNGTQHFVHIRGVDGKAHLLARQLRASLFSSSRTSPRVTVQHARNVVISGMFSKNQVVEWLKARGF